MPARGIPSGGVAPRSNMLHILPRRALPVLVLRHGLCPRTTGTGQQLHHLGPVLTGYYANLKLPYGTGLGTVRRTWGRVIKKYYPDLYSADEEKKRLTTDLVQGLNRAYEELVTHLERK